MSFFFCSWWSWTKWGLWVSLRLYLFFSDVNQVGWGREMSPRFPFAAAWVWDILRFPFAAAWVWDILRNSIIRISSVINTGMSDFHKMTVTLLISYFQKPEPKIIIYRNYKNFSNNEFRSIINTKNGNLQNSNDTSLSSFMNVCKIK